MIRNPTALSFAAVLFFCARFGDAHASGFKILYKFDGSDGNIPNGDLIKDKAGNLYGTTYSGGKYYGNVFRLAPDGTATSLYVFTGGKDGRYPTGGVIKDSAGNF